MMVQEYFSFVNGENLYEQAQRIESNGGDLGYDFNSKAIWGLGMFNDQIPIMLSRGLPLSFTNKYGGGEMIITPEGRVLFEAGHDEDASIENMLADFEDIFKVPFEKVDMEIVA